LHSGGRRWAASVASVVVTGRVVALMWLDPKMDTIQKESV